MVKVEEEEEWYGSVVGVSLVGWYFWTRVVLMDTVRHMGTQRAMI